MDLIERQAVIKAINNMVKECDSVYVTSALRNLEVIVADLPSAQPEKRTDKCTETHACDCISRQAAIDALDKIFPADPMRNDYTQGITCGAALATEYIKQLPSAQPENDWIPVTKKAHPDLPIRVQVQLDNGWIITAYYQEGEWLSVPDCGEPLKDEYVEAWCELPEPYAERRTNERSD